MSNPTEIVKTTDIKHGDTVIINNEWTTVNKKYIHTTFMGTVIHGENFSKSGRMVDRVLFPMWRNGEIQAWVNQL